MPMYEIAVDGQQHSGSYDTEAQAKQALDRVKLDNPGKRVEVLERAADGAGLSRYAGRDANGLPVTTVPNDVRVGGGQAPGSAQQPSEGMLPGPGGAVQTEGAAPGQVGSQVQPDGKSPSMSPGKSHK